MLDLNWESYRTKTTKDLMAEADVFGIVLLGYLATIKGRHLIKIISSSFSIPVAVLGVKYCSKHLVQGINKDSTFILKALKSYFKNMTRIRSPRIWFSLAVHRTFRRQGKYLLLLILG